MRVRAGSAVFALLAATVLAVPAPAAAAPQAPVRTITLVSGDRLQIAADGRSATRVPGGGRDGVTLISRFAGGRLQVVPADALPLLTADRLDPRLFDVTGLLAAGYDERRADLPLIVTFDGRPPTAQAFAGVPARELAAVDGSAVGVTRAQTPELWSALTRGAVPYRKVWLDGIATPAADVSVPMVGAPAAWAQGLTGSGVRVAVLDTGLDVDHPDLAGAITETADFTGGAGDGTVDRIGHGTHVASVIAGSGAASAGRYRGMAPDARLYGATVCTAAGCTESAILDGLRWAVRDKGAKVVNLSFGQPDAPGADLLETAVARLTEDFGTLVVASAGNAPGPVTSPASAPEALAVGASTEDDELATFSAAGGGKPEIVAPGVDITAARSGDSGLPGGAYTTLTGTSVATPHVAGAAALLAQHRPEWTPAQLKAALIGSATPLRAGAVRLDVAKAVTDGAPGAPAAPTGGTVGLTAQFVDRTGAPTTRVLADAVSGDRVVDLSRGGAFRVPPGRWTVTAAIAEPDGTVTLVHRPAMVVRGDTAVTLDARDGRPVDGMPPLPGAARAVFGAPAVAVDTGRGLFTTTGPPTSVAATWNDGAATHETRRSSRGRPLPEVRFSMGAAGRLAFTAPVAAAEFRLDVSYDEGRTWSRPFYTRIGGRGVASLRPPAGATVSLRVFAADGAGNEVGQTVLRAY